MTNTNEVTTYIGVSPDDFGAAGDAVTDDLDKVRLALNEAMSKRIPLILNKTYAIDGALTIENQNGLVIEGSGGLRSISSTATCVLEIKNCTSIVARPGLHVDGQSRENIQCAIKVWATGSGTCSLHSLGFNVVNAVVGWQFGDFSAPDNLLSEIVVHNGYTYNVPQPIVAIGAQTVIEVASYQLVSAGVGALAEKAHVLATVHGATLVINSGECPMPAISSGFGFLCCPIAATSTYNLYGDIVLQGVSVENASVMFLAYNPRSVPSVKPGTGGLRMSGCRGYHTYPGISFQGAADFSGRVVVDATNNFYRGNVTNAKLASWQGPVEYWIDPLAFDSNWTRGLAGFSGGIAIFPYQQIFEASYLAGATFQPGVSDLVFNSVPARPENAHFYSCYDLSTGVFTVPVGGLKGVVATLSFNCGQPSPASSLEVYINGALFDQAGANTHYCNGNFVLGDLSAGDTVSFKFANAGAAFAATGGGKDRITLSARR